VHHDEDPALTALAEVAFWSLCFLETAENVDDDAACAEIERLLFLLGRGGPSARAALCRVAESVASVDNRPEVREFAAGLSCAWDEDQAQA